MTDGDSATLPLHRNEMASSQHSTCRAGGKNNPQEKNTTHRSVALSKHL